MKNNEKSVIKPKRKSYTVQLPVALVNRISFLKKLRKGSIDIGVVFAKSLYPVITDIESKMNLDRDSWKNSKKCPYCDSILIIRNGQKGKFYGCYSFPKCRYTSKV